MAFFDSIKSKNKDSSKDTNLNTTLQQHVGKNINLARIKFIALLLESLYRMQSVSMPKLALAFGGNRTSSSSQRRLERFIACYDLPINIIAKLIISLLPTKAPFALSMDRTHWKSASANMNVLMLAICCQGVAFPVLFSMLPKSGNSSWTERVELMEQFKALFGDACLCLGISCRDICSRKCQASSSVQAQIFGEIHRQIRRGINICSDNDRRMPS